MTSTKLRVCLGAGLLGALALGVACQGDEPSLRQERVGSHHQEIRPTDGTGWHGNGYGPVTVKHWDTPGGRFRIHYTLEGKNAVDATDLDSSGTPDFVETFGKTFDTVLATYLKTGFREPLSDEQYHDRPDYGGDDRFDVYLLDQGTGSDGYLVTESCTSTVPATCSGYMVVENDFKGYSYKTPEEGMKVLASHEFFHAIQRAYRDTLAQNFSEGTAVWGTEHVFPETKDFEHFLPYYFHEAKRPLDDPPLSMTDIFSYGSTIWPRFLTERFGDPVLPAVFVELSTQGKAPTALDAVDTVLTRDHKSSLAEAFSEFALWNLFTGKRATKKKGYAAASTYPQVEIVKETRHHPYRLTGEIAYLSARYFELSVKAGEHITVSSERPAPKLALHLVTGDPSAPSIVSGKATESTISIDAQGPVFLVAASTARTGGKGIPFSIAVTGKAAPAPQSDGAAGADAGLVSPGSDDGGGCALGGRPIFGGGASMLLVGLLLGLALVPKRQRRHKPHRRPPSLLSIIFALGVMATAGACSDDSVAVDAGLDGPSGDGQVDAQGGEAQVDAETPLALGQIVTVDADGEGRITASVPVQGGEELMLLLLGNDATPLTQQSYTILKKTSARVTLPLPKLGPQAGENDEASQAGKRASSPCRFVSELQHLLDSTRRPVWKASLAQRGLFGNDPPKVGDTRQFKIRTVGTTVKTIDAEAIRVDGSAVYWIDKTSQPLATIDPAALKELGDGFEKVILPRERIIYGKESDVDGDGLIHVLLSALVHAEGAVAYVSPCDLVDATKLPQGCVTGNGMELIYLTPPSAISPPYNTPKALLETIAHEFQHSIYFYRKYILNKAEGTKENPYITEGLSHLAQDLSGYQAGNLYVQMATLKAIDSISVPNAIDARISSYVPGSEDGIMRGAGYFLLRYLYDHAGGDAMDAQGNISDKGGIAFLHALIDQPETGKASYLKASKMTFEELVDGFWMTMALSNRVAGGKPVSVDPRYNFLPTTTDPITGRQRGCDLFASFHASQLTGPKTQEISQADGKLRPGGAEFLLDRVAKDTTRYEVSFQTDVKARATLRLIRIR